MKAWKRDQPRITDISVSRVSKPDVPGVSQVEPCQERQIIGSVLLSKMACNLGKPRSRRSKKWARDWKALKGETGDNAGHPSTPYRKRRGCGKRHSVLTEGLETFYAV